MFPPVPDFAPLTSMEERQKIFGPMKYISAPVKGNPENISIQGSWAKDNLVVMPVPGLIGIAGASSTGKVQCHRLVADSLVYMFEEIEQLGLTDDIHTWDGSFCPRFVRGSTKTLSNHAFGTAFDINVEWNPLGKPPAAEGELGCLYRIVEVANRHGWFWGGHYKNRPDGMHFEFSDIERLK